MIIWSTRSIFNFIVAIAKFLNKTDVYERALINRNMQMAFRPGIDLWSTGVSLYHVATGMLPFRPVGGRNNRQTMYIWIII